MVAIYAFKRFLCHPKKATGIPERNTYGFIQKTGVAATPREISKFFYVDEIKQLWLSAASPDVKVEVDDEDIPRDSEGDSSEFAIEKHLEDFLIANWEKTDLGKRFELIEQDGEIVSQQYRTDVGAIDLLVLDKSSKNYVVIELKKGQTSDQTAGQLLRYIGWVRRNLAKGKAVHGIVIASSIDEKLQYALSEIPHASVMTYRLNFTLEPAA